MEQLDLTACDIHRLSAGSSQRMESQRTVDFFDAVSFNASTNPCSEEVVVDAELLGTTSKGQNDWDINLRSDKVSTNNVFEAYEMYDASRGTLYEKDGDKYAKYPKAYTKCKGIAKKYALKFLEKGITNPRKGLDDSNKHIDEYGLLFVGYSSHPHLSQSPWAHNNGNYGVFNTHKFHHYNHEMFQRSYLKRIESKVHPDGTSSVPELPAKVIQVDEDLITHSGLENLITISDTDITIFATSCKPGHKHSLTFRTCKKCLSSTGGSSKQTNVVGPNCSKCASGLLDYNGSSCKAETGTSTLLLRNS